MCIITYPNFYSANSDEVCCKVKEVPKPFVPKCGRRNSLGVLDQNVLFPDTDENPHTDTAQFGEFPHHCTILKDEDIAGNIKPKFLGGASLIARNVVLTAAHVLHIDNSYATK